jgi:hypothetical protein
VRLYESLGRHGLRREADRAFRDAAADDDGDGDAPEGGGGAVDAVAEPELTGMACLLKDGFVGYLRELTKITPPVPKQVLTYCISALLLSCMSAVLISTRSIKVLY